MMEMKEVKEDILEGPLLLQFWPTLKIPLEPVSYVPSNHHTIILPSPTWKRKLFETLFHFEKDLLPMPSSHFDISSFLIQSLRSPSTSSPSPRLSFSLVIMKNQTTNYQPAMIPLDPKLIF
jgi:hypothetical protein